MGVNVLRYSKNEFIKVINHIKETVDFNSRLNEAGKSAGEYHVEFYYPDCTYELCRTLELMFNDTGATVEWFCFDIEFGEKYEAGDNMLFDEEWPLRNPGELYDYLVEIARLNSDAKED